MQCKCCMHEVPEGSAVCDICRFPLLASGGADIDGAAAQYRSERLDGCSVAVKVYYYEPDDKCDLVERKSEYVTLCDALSLPYKEIKWFDGEYNPPEVKRSIELDVRVTRPSGSVDKTLTVKPDGAIKCTGLGLYLDEGLRVRLAAGSRTDSVLSDAVSLI